jgi:hypothetical protein
MKTRQEQQAMVDRLKTWEKPYGMLTEDEREFLLHNNHQCEVFISMWCPYDNAPSSIQTGNNMHHHYTYRLKEDFQLPPEPEKERWFFNTNTKDIFNLTTVSDRDVQNGWIEITAEQVPVKVEPKFVEKTIPIIKDKKGRLAVALDGMKPLSEAWLYAINRGLCAWFSYPDKDGQVAWITNPCGISGKAPTQMRLMMEEQK